MNKPSDFNDMQMITSPETVENYLKNQIQTTDDPQWMPIGYHVDKTGLYFEDKRISSPLKVVAWCRDHKSKNWSKLIELYDPDNRKHEIIIPASILKGDFNDLKAQLLDYGVQLTADGQKKVPQYIAFANPRKRITTIKKAGWHGSEYYLPGSDTLNDKGLYFDGCQSRFEGFATKGTLEAWQQNVAYYCAGNSRLLFAIALSCSGPLISLCDEENIGCHLNGMSSIGKTRALQVANSVCGSPKRLRSWRSTANGLEATAEAFNDGTLFLDEIGEVSGQSLGAAVYMLGNGQGKKRMNRDITVREPFKWSVSFLSTGEITLQDKLQEVDKTYRAGMGVRMIDIPADAGQNMGVFEHIHNFDSPAAFAKMFDQNINQYYGTALPAFIQSISDRKCDIKDLVQKHRQRFLEKCQNIENIGQMDRVCNKFAFIAASGELAIEFGILPYDSGTIIDASYQCLQSHIDFRGHTGFDEVNLALDRLKLFIDQHHASRFIFIGKNVEVLNPNQMYQKIAGYKQHIADNSDNPCEFYIFPTVLKNEIFKGLNSKNLYKSFIKMGILYPGKNDEPYVSKCFHGHSKRLYHFSAEVFCDG